MPSEIDDLAFEGLEDALAFVPAFVDSWRPVVGTFGRPLGETRAKRLQRRPAAPISNIAVILPHGLVQRDPAGSRIDIGQGSSNVLRECVRKVRCLVVIKAVVAGERHCLGRRLEFHCGMKGAQNRQKAAAARTFDHLSPDGCFRAAESAI